MEEDYLPLETEFSLKVFERDLDEAVTNLDEAKQLICYMQRQIVTKDLLCKAMLKRLTK